MFYCEECRKRNEWPESMFKSAGRCEVCGRSAICSDIPSSQLPLPKQNVSVTVDDMKLKKLGLRVQNWKQSINDEKPLTFELCHLHSEVSECFEALRDAEKASLKGDYSVLHELQRTWDKKGHPEGFGIELADVVIIATYIAARYGIDLEEMVERKMTFHEENVIKKVAR